MLAGKPTENVAVKYFTEHMGYVFNKFHICFFLSVLKGVTKGSQFPGRRITMGAPKSSTSLQVLSSMQLICFRKIQV